MLRRPLANDPDHPRYGRISDLERDVLADLEQLVGVVRDLLARVDELERSAAPQQDS